MIAARLDFFLPTKMIDHFSGDGLYVELEYTERIIGQNTRNPSVYINYYMY